MLNISVHMNRRAVSTGKDHPETGSYENSPLTIRGPKMLIKRPRGMEYTTLKGVTEVDFRSLPGQLSSTYQGVAPHYADVLTAVLPEILLWWTKNFLCPVAVCALGSRDSAS